VAELERPPDCALRAATDPDLRLLRGMRLGGRVVERPEVPVEVALALPERAHQPDPLVGTPAAALELDAHEVELVPVPAHPESELLGCLGDAADPVGIRIQAIVRQNDAEMHQPSLTAWKKLRLPRVE